MGLPWFAHEAKANRDSKMKKLLMRYGAEGYGLYWYCVEHVADNVGPKLTFEVEHDSEILAHELQIDTLRVEEMMRYMVSVGLFEESEGVISCLSLLKHLTPKCTRNEELKTLIREAKSIPMSATVPDSPRESETVPPRGEERRGEENKRIGAKAPPRKRFKPPTQKEVEAYMLEKGASQSVALTESQKLIDYYGSIGWERGRGVTIKSWKHCVSGWLNRREEFGGKTEISFI